MQRKLFLIAGLFLFNLPFTLHLQAQTEQQCVVVETAAGQRMEYLLSDQPRIVHNDATVTLTTTNATVEFQTSEVSKIYASTMDVVIVIKSIKTDGDIHLTDDFVSLTGYTPHESVSLYTSDGKLLKQRTADSQGRLILSLTQLHSGIYIIKTQQQSIKFTKK